MIHDKPLRKSIAALVCLALGASGGDAAPTEVEYPPASRASLGTEDDSSGPPTEVQPPLSRLPAVEPTLADPRSAPRPATKEKDITPIGEPALADPPDENSPPPGSADITPIELPEPIATRQTVFSIPFKVDPPSNAAATPVEIQLLVSLDEGAKWQFATKVKPDKGNFVFKAPHDGLYWFAIQTVDRQGKLHPPAPTLPELRVIIDTLPPRLDLSAKRGTGGEIIVEWQALDTALKHDSLNIEYQSAPGEAWEPLAVDPTTGHTQRNSLGGRAAWWPRISGGEIAIRARVSDVAGNQSVKQVKLPATEAPGIDNLAARPTIERPPLGDSNTTAPPTTQTPPPTAQPARQPAAPATTQSPPAHQFAAGDPFAKRGPVQNAFDPLGTRSASSDPAPPQNAIAWPADRTNGPLNADRVTTSPADPTTGVASSNAQPNSNASAAAKPINPDWRSSGPQRQTTGTPALPISRSTGPREPAGRFDLSQIPPGERPSMVSTRTFELEYEVDAIGTSGIARVELWGTRDGGRNWASYAVDNDNRSPISVTVEGEGVYGFRIVVQSGNGLGGLPPRPGDAPEIWTAVDLTPPVAKITSADVGRELGDIVIRWQAADELLERRPISLFYSDRPTGPWTPIAAGLDNSGGYAWRLDNGVPDRVYLRVEARDEAGNIGSFDTKDPLALERQRPQGRIRGVHSK